MSLSRPPIFRDEKHRGSHGVCQSLSLSASRSPANGSFPAIFLLTFLSYPVTYGLAFPPFRSIGKPAVGTAENDNNLSQMLLSCQLYSGKNGKAPPSEKSFPFLRIIPHYVCHQRSDASMWCLTGGGSSGSLLQPWRGLNLIWLPTLAAELFVPVELI
jgi:hypothetical protein